MVLEIKDLIKDYYHKEKKIEVLKSLSYNFEKGKFYGIMGHSGSGKTTLFNIIGTIDKEYNGNILVNSKNISSLNDEDMASLRNLEIGFVFQDFFLDEGLTALENVMVPMIINANIPKEEREVIAKKLLKEVGMEDREKHFPKELSGGEKQRVAIARALAKDTPIIIADEPTGNLDSRSAKAIIKLLSEISKDKLVIIVTHNYEEVEEYVTRKIKMHDGRILEDKKIKNIDNNLQHKESNYKNITRLNKLRLGIRNTFNIIPKFLLVLAVYLFIVVALMAEYSSFKEQEYIASNSGYNNYFQIFFVNLNPSH